LEISLWIGAELEKIEAKMMELAKQKNEYIRKKYPRKMLLLTFLPKEMNINWTYWKVWKTDPLLFMNKEISLIFVEDLISRIQVLLKQPKY
jgi:hypothetical protein